MKKYTEKEVEYLLLKQREHCAFAIGLQSMIMNYPADFGKIKYIIENAPIINYEEHIKTFLNGNSDPKGN